MSFSRPRSFRRPILFALALGLLAASSGVRVPCAAAAAKDAGVSASLRSDLGRLRALQAASRWVAVDSFATAALERAASGGVRKGSRADSLAVAELQFAIAESADMRGDVQSPRAISYAELAAGIRLRHLPAGDPLIDRSLYMAGNVSYQTQPAKTAYYAGLMLEQRLGLVPPNDSLVADAYESVGQGEAAQGHAEPAAEAFTKAIEMWKRLYGPNDRHVANMLAWLADTYQMRGDLRRAVELQQEALASLDRSGSSDAQLRGRIYSSLTSLHQNLGELGRAVDWARENVRVFSGPDANVSVSLASRNNYAVLLRDFGDVPGARDAFAALIPAYVSFAGDSSWMTSIVRMNYGDAALGAGDTTLAWSMFRQAEDHLLAVRDPSGDAALALAIRGQASILFGRGELHEALRQIDRAIAINDGTSQPDVPLRVTGRALRLQILSSLGDVAAIDSARTELAATAERRGLMRTGSAAVVAHWLAYADRGLGRRDAAWSGALEADAFARDRLRLGAITLPDVRSLELARRRSYILDQVLDLADARSPERWETAWDRVVRTRGLVRSELRKRRLPAALATDTTVVGTRERWRAAQLALARRAVRGAAAPGDSAAQAAIAKLRARAEETERDFARELLAHGGDTTKVDVGLADVRARLAPEQVLVGFSEFVDSARVTRLVAFVARHGAGAVSRIELGRSDEIAPLVAAWKDRLARSPGKNARPGGDAERLCRADGAAVRNRVWDPLARAISGAHDVLLVPDGPLVDLPWLALPVGSRDYLVEEADAPRVLDAERDLLTPASRASTAERLFALGDPDFAGVPVAEVAAISTAPEPPSAVASAAPASAGTTRDASAPCVTALPQRFPPLPGTRDEVNAVVAAQASADVLLGARASEDALKRLAPGHSILHLATHGIVVADRCAETDGLGAPVAAATSDSTRGIGGVQDVSAATSSKASPGATTPSAPKPGATPPASPWLGRRVWLAFAGADHARETNEGEDGLLTAEEVLTLDLSGTDWVVLSACHSGLSESWRYEGALGMRRAFALAGARAVITSQWAVEDVAAIGWMKALYAARAGGERRASAAVRRAARDVLSERRRRGETTHPFYWAAFAASGD